MSNNEHTTGNDTDEDRSVEAKAQLTEADSIATAFESISDRTDPDSIGTEKIPSFSDTNQDVIRELEHTEMDSRVVWDVIHLWVERERIRSEQPTVVTDEGERVFSDEASEQALRTIEQLDTKLAQLLLSNQGAVIGALLRDEEQFVR